MGVATRVTMRVVVDEDINTLATIIPSVEMLGPITRSQAQQLNHQVSRSYAPPPIILRADYYLMI
jgi:hypothetical protein